MWCVVWCLVSVYGCGSVCVCVVSVWYLCMCGVVSVVCVYVWCSKYGVCVCVWCLWCVCVWYGKCVVCGLCGVWCMYVGCVCVVSVGCVCGMPVYIIWSPSYLRAIQRWDFGFELHGCAGCLQLCCIKFF